MPRHPLRLLAAVPLLCVGIAGAQSASAQAASADQTTPAAPTAGPAVAGQPGADGRAGIDRAAWNKRLCVDRFARHAARAAFLEARLELTAQQRPAWAKWQQARAATAARLRDACEAAVHGATPPTLLERQAQKEKMLSVKLHGLHDSRAALQALYAELTPEQRAIIDRPHGAREHRGSHPHPHDRDNR